MLVEKNENCNYIPIEQLDTIICFSEIDLNKRVLSLLNQYGVSILFFNFYGNYIGRFSPKKYADGRILLEQVNAYNNPKIRLFIAKQIQKSSIRNMLSLLKYYLKKDVIISEEIAAIDMCIEDLSNADTLEQSLLIEARARQIYYSCFDRIIENNDFCFESRSKHPPENRLNAMLNYGYAILYGVYPSVLDRSSLMPQISFIHSLSKSSDALQYDLADIMKPVIIDRMIIRMIRRQQITAEDFNLEQGRCFLNKEGCEKFIREFDIQLKTSVKDGERNYSYRSLISREVHKLSEFIKDNQKGYKPYVMKW